MPGVMELESMMIRLIGDGSSYNQMMATAQTAASRTATRINEHGSQIQKIADKVKSYAASASSSVKGLMASVTSTAMGGLSAVGGSMIPGAMGMAGIAGMAGAAGWGIKLAGEAERSAIAFEVMLGSASAAKTMLKEITDFAAKTPFEMPGLRQNAQLLLNFGMAQEKIMPTLKALGDVAGGDQQRLDGLTYAFAQTQAAGRLMGQDLLQMINWGFNPLQEISRKTGKSMAALKQEMEKGAISAKMVEEAFASATSEGGKFHGMMDKQSRTILGLMSTMSDSIKMQFANFGTMLVEKLHLRDVLSNMIAMVDKFGPMVVDKLGAGIDWLVTTYDKLTNRIDYFVVPALMSIGDTIMGSINAVRNWVSANSEMLATIAATVAGALAIFAAFSALSVAVPAALGLVSGALALVLNPVGLIVVGVGAATAAFVQWTDMGKVFSEKVGAALSYVKEQLGLLVALVKLGEFEKAWKVTTTASSLAWHKFIAGIKNIWVESIGFIRITWQNMINAVSHGMLKFITDWKKSINQGIELYNKVKGALGQGAMPDIKFRFNTKLDAETLAESRRMGREAVARIQTDIDKKKAKNDAPVKEAQEAYDKAQKTAKDVVKNNARGPSFDQTWLGMGINFAGWVTEQVQTALPLANKAGEDLGKAATSGVKSELKALQAIQAGSADAYNALESYKAKLTTNQQVKIAAAPVPPGDKKPTEEMNGSLRELVEQGRQKAGTVIEFVSSGLSGLLT